VIVTQGVIYHSNRGDEGEVDRLSNWKERRSVSTWLNKHSSYNGLTYQRHISVIPILKETSKFMFLFCPWEKTAKLHCYRIYLGVFVTIKSKCELLR